uniref:CD63 antigen n=1 Tax=Aceria tosichella TaxID=561515 RepID=A0A6G1S9L9_9ACAR
MAKCCFLGNCGQLAGVLGILARVVLYVTCLIMALGSISMLVLPHIKDSHSGKNIAPELGLGGSILGVVLLITSMIGMNGAYTRDPRSLKIFAMILGSAAMMMAVTTYNRYTERATILDSFHDKLLLAHSNYAWYQGEENTSTMVLDSIQSTYECCGIMGPYDWVHSKPWYLAKGVLPRSCCSSKSQAFSTDGRCHTKDAYTVGCLPRYAQIQRSQLASNTFDVIASVSLVILALSIAKPNPNTSSPNPLTTGAQQRAQFDGSTPGWHIEDQYNKELSPPRRDPGVFQEKADLYVPPPSYSMT